MLSFGYTLLAHEAIAAAELAGLDPMVGFLHQHR
jgi:CRISP-associated protein Cas1